MMEVTGRSLQFACVVTLLLSICVGNVAEGRGSGVLSKVRQVPMVERGVAALTNVKNNWGQKMLTVGVSALLACGAMSCAPDPTPGLVNHGYYVASYDDQNIAYMDNTGDGTILTGFVVYDDLTQFLIVKVVDELGIYEERISHNAILGMHYPNHELVGAEVVYVAGLADRRGLMTIHGTIDVVYAQSVLISSVMEDYRDRYGDKMKRKVNSYKALPSAFVIAAHSGIDTNGNFVTFSTPYSVTLPANRVSTERGN